MTTKKAGASEVQGENSKTSTATEPAVKLNLEDYLLAAKPHAGLVASYVAEAAQKPAMLEAKSTREWAAAFTAQANREY